MARSLHLEVVGRPAACGGVLLLAYAAVSCSAANTVTAPPTLNDSTGSAYSCESAQSQLDPVVVEWTATARSAFQRQLQQSVVVVSFQGCTLRVLDGCTAKGKYAYGGLTKTSETWNIKKTADLYARLPLAALALKGEVSGDKGLALSYSIVGWQGSVLRDQLGREELVGGAACQGATHFIRRVDLGAFRLASASTHQMSADATFAGVQAAGSESIVRQGGELSACLGGQVTPESGCDVPVQVHLVPLQDKVAAALACRDDEELYVDTCRPASTKEPICPPGSRWNGTKCAGNLCPAGTTLVGADCVETKRITETACPAGTTWNGRACVGNTQVVCPPGTDEIGGECVRKQVVTKVECPTNTLWNGSSCVGRVTLDCPPGLVRVAGRGCVNVAASSGTPGESTVRPASDARMAPQSPLSCPSNMALIRAGSLQMGSAAGSGESNELPVHAVTVSSFCIDRTEVTVADYARCVAAGACPAAAADVGWPNMRDADRGFGKFCNGQRSDRQNHPINCVDWSAADAFCRWATKRLPTEVEWEFAARGEAARSYPWGNAAPSPGQLNACSGECANLLSSEFGKPTTPLFAVGDGYEGTAPVGAFPKGATPDGLLDMAGNVWEWTASWYGPYPDVSQSGTDRVYRGGAWNSGDSSTFRGARRGHFDPSMRSHTVGFRCAR